MTFITCATIRPLKSQHTLWCLKKKYKKKNPRRKDDTKFEEFCLRKVEKKRQKKLFDVSLFYCRYSGIFENT